MLEFIDAEGRTITADAVHCQKETCKKIVAGDGNYVIGLKENQKTLHDDIELFINSEGNAVSTGRHTTIEKNGGRVEKVTDISWLEAQNERAGLKSVFAVRRTVIAQGATSD